MPTYASPRISVQEYDVSITVPSPGATVGALAGVMTWGPLNQRVLLESEAQMVTRFNSPTNLNAETWFTAVSFLAYGAPLWFVRVANTTTTNGSIGTLSALANTAMVSNVLAQMVLNDNDYINHQNLFDSNMRYVARYPGSLGNSLRVSVCYTANAFSSVINLASYGTGATFTAIPGSNTATIVINAASITLANTAATNLANAMALSDVLFVGNVSVGVQDMSISAINYAANNATGNSITGQATITLNFVDELSIHTTYTSTTTLTRNWEFYAFIGKAPGQSPYVYQFGNVSANDQMHIVLVDNGGIISGVPGTVLETYAFLSRASDAQAADGSSIFYQTVINQQSSYMWFCADDSLAVSNTSNNIVSSTHDQIMNIPFAGGADGAGESNVAMGIICSGYDYFGSTEDVSIDLIMQGKNLGTGIYSGQLANYLIDNLAEPRMDCVVFASPDYSNVVNNRGNEMTSIMAFRNNLRDTSYGVLDTGYKYMYDRYNNLYRWIPLNGDIAGLCAFTDRVRAPWWSPAGFNRGNIKNVIQLAYNPPVDERDQLYPVDVDPVVSFPGMGTVLFGDKTLLSVPNSAFSRINVRRLFITMEKAIKQMALAFLFEFNDAFTRANFVNIVTPYLKDIKAQRGITDFLVRCDETNNTPQVIDNNQFIGDIFVKPNRSINFIDLNFVAVGTAITFSEAEGLVP